MSPLGFFLIAIIVVLPIAWLVAEFRGGRTLRMTLGILAIGIIATCVWALTSVPTRFNYNAWYGGATGDPISTSLQQIEDGHLDRVLRVWRELDQQYQPTYENQAHYRELVEDANRRMKGERPIKVGSPWDASVFRPESWLGHWEDGFGYWIVINDVGRPYDVVQAGQPRSNVHSVSVSSDFGVLKFQEGDQWLHTLILKSKYEASCEWFDLKKGTVWETRSVYKLIRAFDEQKAMNRQANRPETNRTSSATNALHAPSR